MTGVALVPKLLTRTPAEADAFLDCTTDFGFDGAAFVAEDYRAVALEALAKTNAQPRDVAAVGITNQRETTIVWDRTTGKPIGWP